MVPSLEEVIKALESCNMKEPKCEKCFADGPGFGFACRESVMKWACYYLKKKAEHENTDGSFMVGRNGITKF